MFTYSYTFAVGCIVSHRTYRATMHGVTDRQTDIQKDRLSAIRSAKCS